MATMHEHKLLDQMALDRMVRDWHKTIDQQVMRTLLGSTPCAVDPILGHEQLSIGSPPYPDQRTLNFPVWPPGGCFSIGSSADIEAAIAEAEAEREKAAAIKAGQERVARVDQVVADLQAGLIGADKIEQLTAAITRATSDAKLRRAVSR
jgi:hypothetical protein